MRMLGRRQSLRGDSVMADYVPDEPLIERPDIEWVNKTWVRWLLRVCSLASLVSVSANTPRTMHDYPSLVYITFCCDVFVTLLFTAEMIAKMHMYGIIKGDLPYLKDRWCQYDFAMVFFLWTSVILQIFEITEYIESYSAFTIVRAPRPLIVVRLIRIFLKFQMPKSQLKQIVKRSSQQINNVTLFFLFFLSLYGLLGVQLFGEMENHCVLNDTDPEAVDINSLAIPDTYCSDDHDSGYQCPPGMKCIPLNMEKKVLGFNGFDNFAQSIFTVYQASSQEGWAYMMYRSIDSLPTWRATFFFSTMIFFLPWLVKNVFIAVITETFNEIRVQFQQMWGVRAQIQQETKTQVLLGDTNSWKLLYVDDNKPKGWAPTRYLKHIQSAGFYLLIMAAIVANAIVAASIRFDHVIGKAREEYYMYYYYCEIGFTIFFDLEVLIKIWCMGLRGYFRLTIHKFEFLLAIGTTLRIVPSLFMTSLTYFQVLRVVRLIKASPILEDFVYKIFGPGKKLGSLILFTMCLLVISSSISMQVFCFLKEDVKFQTFADAFMSMFQILTQEGWVEVMDMTMIHSMNRAADNIAPFVALYFICYHLFVTLIVLSLFVAVILDNLELDEDFKKLKQMKAREQSAGIQETLPLRLRVFEKFPDRPTMARLHKVPSDFSLPKVRESFIRHYLEEQCDEEEELLIKMRPGFDNSSITFRKRRPLQLLGSLAQPRNGDYEQKKTSIANVVCDANNQRLLLGDSGQIPLPKGLPSHGTISSKHVRLEQKSVRRSVRGSLKIKQQHLDHLKENGDIGAMNRTFSSRKVQDIDIKSIQAKRQQAEMRRNQREEDLRENHPFFDTPLFAVGRESRFRKFCQRVVYARYDTSSKDPITGKERKIKYKRLRNLLGLVTYLDWLMILITTISCASMMLETPQRRVTEDATLQIAEYLFVVFMSLELALKILADGLLFTPKALIKDMAGILDLFIYMVTLVFVWWMPHDVAPQSGAHLLLILRCLRPLRIFNLVPHMRRVVSELVRGFKEILLVSVLLIVLLFVFASYGVQLYGGRLARCNDPSITNRSDCHGVFMRQIFVTKVKIGLGDDHPAMLVPRVWANPRRFNFDNIGYAMLALFEVLSFKGWLDIRDVLIIRLGAASAVYIHIFIFLGSMIGLTLFVGVVIANYSENKGTALLTVDQKRWCDLKKRLKIAQPLHLPARPDGRKFRSFIYDITQNIIFKRIVACSVIINSSLLYFTWETENDTTSKLVVISSLLNLVFVAEVVMKLIAFTPRGYWQSRRNRYDLVVTILGVIWVVLNFTIQTEETHMFGFMVIILRFFTITGKHPTLKMLMLTVVVSVYKSFFIIMGMFLLILSYALAGVILFGNVKYGENIGRQENFETAIQGITLLFRVVTGVDWNKIMHDCMVTPPFCTPGRNYWESDCGNFTGSLVFFCSFYVIITYIVLNLLVAIIMENFSLFYSNEEDALLSYADIRNFQNTWNVVDVIQRGVIPIKKVKFILRLLEGRLEVDPAKDRLLFKHMCYELERLHNGDDVTFHDVLNMLSYRSVDIRKSLQLEELMAREELEYIIEEEVAKQTIRSWLDNCLKRIRAKEQKTSLLARLRATNEQTAAFPFDDRKEREAERDSDTKDTEKTRERKKGIVMMTRTDSLSSITGRKYLAPIFPLEALGGRNDKQSRSDSKGRKSRSPSSSTSKGVPAPEPCGVPTGGTTATTPAEVVDISSNKTSLPRSASGIGEVRDWWKEQVGYDSGSELKK